MSKVILITSGKGGTGKTMFATNLGATLAQKGYKTVVIDLDLGLRNLDLYLGIENNVVYDVYDVMTGVCRIKQALIKDKRFDELYIMAASPFKDEGNIAPLHVKVLCDKLKNQFDYIVIDAPSGLGDEMILASAAAELAIILTTPEYSAIRNADATDRELLKLGIKNRFVVVNKVMMELINQGYAPSIQEINTLIRPEILGIIQFDENIHISTNVGEPIVIKEDTYIKSNFLKITNRLIEE